MEKELASILKYFAFFNYFPSFNDVYRFFPKKISKKQLKNEFKKRKYTPVEYSILASKRGNILFREKLKKVQPYIKFIAFFSQIKLIGLSGSMAMKNPKSEDDIDLFIISQKDKLFTARFLATIISFIMGLKREIGQIEAPNKVCLNLFFDESNLIVPNYKKTGYIAHEILQMKPLVNKDQTYEKFLLANQWVFKLFPNGKSKYQIINPKSQISSKHFKFKIADWLESFLKNVQLKFINKHKTTEIITNTQLWFHPDDFEKKMKF